MQLRYWELKMGLHKNKLLLCVPFKISLAHSPVSSIIKLIKIFSHFRLSLKVTRNSISSCEMRRKNCNGDVCLQFIFIDVISDIFSTAGWEKVFLILIFISSRKIISFFLKRLKLYWLKGIKWSYLKMWEIFMGAKESFRRIFFYNWIYRFIRKIWGCWKKKSQKRIRNFYF